MAGIILLLDLILTDRTSYEMDQDTIFGRSFV